MNQTISMDLLQRFDSLAISPLSKDRTGYYVCKRVFDLFFASIMLILSLPLFLLISILIAIDSPGPIFYSQDRVNAKRWRRNGFSYWQRSNFTCYKFRTMVKDANSSLHQAYVQAFISNNQDQINEIQGESTEIRKLVNDPRVTRMGKFLRKSSLDELPQLWNVIKGDMSLVGPRPPIPYELEDYQPWHFHRLQTIPGLTGLWQVTARSSSDFDEMVNLDIQYIENQSLWLDLVILFKTPSAVISSNGAL
jgi:lipopolysaccharide/colanic/teichoic acid biosynthesis glycosyltransferase